MVDPMLQSKSKESNPMWCMSLGVLILIPCLSSKQQPGSTGRHSAELGAGCRSWPEVSLSFLGLTSPTTEKEIEIIWVLKKSACLGLRMTVLIFEYL